jgi:hypothetical protein
MVIEKKPKSQSVEKKGIDLDFTDQDMMMIMMMVVMVFMLQGMFSPLTQSAQRYFTNQAFQGDLESKILLPTDQVQYWDLINQDPFTPLISVFFINRGPNTVYIAINSSLDWLTMLPGETRTVSHVGADKRIEIIFYRCDAGLTSVVEAEGHF